MAKVLLTGAAGFIGSHTAEALLQQGDTVIGVDNYDPYYDPSRKRRNVQMVRSHSAAERFHLVELDLRDAPAVQRLFSSHRFDTVVHLAALAGVRASIDRPRAYADVNFGATTTLLEQAVAGRVGNVVLASTSSVYGATKKLPFQEDDSCNRQLSPYAATKRAAELVAYTFHHLHGLPVTALRFFTVYGPRNRPDMMAYKLLDSIFHGTEVPLFDAGQMWRDWTFVADIVEGIRSAANQPLGYGVLNIGRGEPVLLADFVRILEDLSGQRANLVPATRPRADVTKTWADISRIRKLLDYAPRTSILTGAAALLQWYRSEGLDSDDRPGSS